jgi:hypothetical protein
MAQRIIGSNATIAWFGVTAFMPLAKDFLRVGT